MRACCIFKIFTKNWCSAGFSVLYFTQMFMPIYIYTYVFLLLYDYMHIVIQNIKHGIMKHEKIISKNFKTLFIYSKNTLFSLWFSRSRLSLLKRIINLPITDCKAQNTVNCKKYLIIKN